MKKVAKRIMAFVLTLAIALGTFIAVPAKKVEAASKISVPSTVRCGVGMKDGASFRIDLTNKNDKVQKMTVYKGSSGTTTTTALRCKVTTKYNNGSNCYRTISFYAAKAGIYRIKLAIKPSGRSLTYRTVTVRATATGLSPIKKVTLNGTQVNSKHNLNYYYTGKTQGKVKFEMAYGCSMKKIEVTYLDQNGDSYTRKFKNGANIAFGKIGNSYYYGNDNYDDNSYSFYAYTEFKITYTDKFSSSTTNEYTTYFTFYRPAAVWP